MKNPFEIEREQLMDEILNVDADSFDETALRVFKFQYEYNQVYRKYVDLLGSSSIASVDRLEDIPFLPIETFKKHRVLCGEESGSERVFRSSGTQGQPRSVHYVRSLDWYHRICKSSFETCFGRSPSDYSWIGLLPSYLEREDASLVEMVRHFMLEAGQDPQEYFFLHDPEAVIQKLRELRKQAGKVILIGVTFALLDTIAISKESFQDVTVIETGGMKGRRKEMVREELHRRIRSQWEIGGLSSEYGMTELMSQAYWFPQRGFLPGNTLRLLGREVSDPLAVRAEGRNLALNAIDLGNIDSCCFIATDDIGTVRGDGSFDVFGRLEGSEMRGCNLMYLED